MALRPSPGRVGVEEIDLSALLPLLQQSPEYPGLVGRLRAKGNGLRATVLSAARPFLVAGLHRDLGLPFLLVTPDSEAARKLYEQLLCWHAGGSEVLLFPSAEGLPYERLISDPRLAAERLKTLFVLASLRGRPGPGREGQGKMPLVVASAGALLYRTIQQEDLATCYQRISMGAELNPRSAVEQWLRMGYEMEPQVIGTGAMAWRGGIIDIYPPCSELPVRIELLGNKVDSIRLFDPANQRSVRRIEYIDIIPASEFVSTERNIDSLRNRAASLDFAACVPEQRDKFRDEIARAVDGGRFPGIEFYLPLLRGGSLLDYLPEGTALVFDEPADVKREMERLQEEGAQMHQAQEKAGSLPVGLPTGYLDKEKVAGIVEGMHGLSLEGQPWEAPGAEPFTPISGVPTYAGQLKGFLRRMKEALDGGARVVVVSHQAYRLAELLDSEGVLASPVSRIEEEPPPGTLALVRGSLPEGWSLKSSTGTLLLFTDLELFGFVKQQRKARRGWVRYPVSLPELTPGDYVTHIEHGISHFAGMSRMNLNGGEKEYMILEYAAGDRLYVPADQVDRVSRYVGSGGTPPSLTRLGTQEWTHTKGRVRRAVAEMARELLELYATREVLPGIPFLPDTPWQWELEVSFPYSETPDQLETIQQVKKDMESPTPMERLVCGDAGYGKTEVALRAAFKAVMGGKQVALLVPTTVLAQQHFETFRERLEAFPVRVEMLSRFRSDGEQRKVIEELAKGSVDICIGTHRLLQKDVAFKDLGLVIIDEEQRFGVAHKERLKQLRREVDVLTLSATPIPRTLYVSLVGVRDLSVIDTPPEDRLAVETVVAENDDLLLQRAILREIERGGQVFFVHNRVRSIQEVARKLKGLVPGVMISVAHGQMSSEELEATMADFYTGKSNVLVCTTIIESGLDMPRVNTLIVDRADAMGLTQLYQLRGRVGRGSSKAYAYFLVDRGKNITPQARKRLQTIFEASELGAGFRIAMKDLEIRGAGNILGPEQSGHIAAVGFDLYSHMLAEAVEALKQGRGQPLAVESIVQRDLQPEAMPAIDLPLDAYVPEDYISDYGARLAIYRRLTRMREAGAVDAIEDELKDRFGEIPPSLRDLLYGVRLRVLAMEKGIESLSMESGKVVIRFREGSGKPALLLLKSSLGEGVEVGLTQLKVAMRGAAKEWKEGLLRVMKALPARPSVRRGEPLFQKAL